MLLVAPVPSQKAVLGLGGGSRSRSRSEPMWAPSEAPWAILAPLLGRKGEKERKGTPESRQDSVGQHQN